MTDISLSATINLDTLANKIVWQSDYDSDTVLAFIKDLDAAVCDWDFTKQIRDWAKAEIKRAKRLGYTS